MKTVVWWIRRDLRLNDNTALKSAVNTGLPIIPLFIIDPALKKSPGHTRQNFLYEGLHCLQKDLSSRGNALVIKEGSPLNILAELVANYEVQMIFAEEDFTPYAIKRDDRIAQSLPLTLTSGLTFIHPGQVRKSDGNPYTIFTPFSKAWKSLPITASEPWKAPINILTNPAIKSNPFSTYTKSSLFNAGEYEASQRLFQFTQDKIYNYKEERDRMDLDGTSTLSPYLRFGMLSINQALFAIPKIQNRNLSNSQEQGVATWFNELIWREFYQNILYHFPNVKQEAFNPKYRNIEWLNSAEHLNAWKNGQTGFPIVDAAMRQLSSTGWMHNRARMIVASFLSKDLLINWQEGESWFMDNLIDGDLAANNGGWQWTAGVGTDAAPYFRIFNPYLQSEKFDPQGKYIRKWIPELSLLPNKYIHHPDLMPSAEQLNYGCKIGKDYPAPIINRKETRQRTLDAYKKASSLL